MNTTELISDLTAEKLITLWEKACNWSLPIDNYEKSGSPEYPIYSIKLSTNVSLVITLEDKHTIRLLFSNFLTYKKFEITPDQFGELSLLHETSINEKQKSFNKELIQKGENELHSLLNASQF